MPDYHDVLAVAVGAAQEAGAILRAGFLRPGGPAGAGEYADDDRPVEELIRARLAAVAPDWGFHGEETGYQAGADPTHLWLVDPNDGTRSYLEGYRGSAVSIALLRDGVPILGVVYAFVAPDNDGDLFAWAEGCGPLHRNGRPVPPRQWSESLSADSVIITSYRAERQPKAYLAAIAPAVYRPATSVAYRMGLLAAGVGDAVLDINGLRDWDYGGGHALVIGAGGDLLDQDGDPIRYAADGRSSCTRCFAGAPALAHQLSQRPWSTVTGSNQEYDPAGDQLHCVVTGQTIADQDLLLRIQGCWLGQLTGDALGSMVEFTAADEIRRRYPDGLRILGPSPVFSTLAGQPTDDSELALALTRALAEARGYDEERVANAYGEWLASGPFDVGNTIAAALRPLRTATGSKAEAARAAASRTSEANGALMRQSPLAIWGYRLPAAELDQFVRADTTLTHPHRVCQDASSAFIVALAATIRDGLDAEGAYEAAIMWDREHGASPSITQALMAARDQPPDYKHNIGHVPIAVQNAFYQALHAPTFEAGIVATVMAGGDTDTNAAISGALLGALHSAHAVPAQWREAILSCHPQAGAAGVRQPRPRQYWPINALVVAERLALVGSPQ